MTRGKKNNLDGLFEAWRSCDNAYMKLIRQWGISLNTVWALDYIAKHPDGVEPTVLADDTNMLRQTITVVLNDLEKRGFLRREFHATDHRKKIIRLTDEGVAFSRKVLDTISGTEQDAADTLSAEEQAQLILLSRRFCSSFAQKVNEATTNKKERC